MLARRELPPYLPQVWQQVESAFSKPVYIRALQHVVKLHDVYKFSGGFYHVNNTGVIITIGSVVAHNVENSVVNICIHKESVFHGEIEFHHKAFELLDEGFRNFIGVGEAVVSCDGVEFCLVWDASYRPNICHYELPAIQTV